MQRGALKEFTPISPTHQPGPDTISGVSRASSRSVPAGPVRRHQLQLVREVVAGQRAGHPASADRDLPVVVSEAGLVGEPPHHARGRRGRADHVDACARCSRCRRAPPAAPIATAAATTAGAAGTGGGRGSKRARRQRGDAGERPGGEDEERGRVRRSELEVRHQAPAQDQRRAGRGGVAEPARQARGQRDGEDRERDRGQQVADRRDRPARRAWSARARSAAPCPRMPTRSGCRARPRPRPRAACAAGAGRSAERAAPASSTASPPTSAIQPPPSREL